MCSTRGGGLEHGVEVGGDEARVGADAVDEPPILAADVDDQRLAGRQLAVDHERAGVDLVRLERLGGEPAEDVVADAGADGRRDAQPGEVDRRVGGAAADVQHQLIDRDQLAGPRQVIESAGRGGRPRRGRHRRPGRRVEAFEGEFDTRAVSLA